jgi:hypothetical protein
MYPIVSGDFNAEPCVEEEMQKNSELENPTCKNGNPIYLLGCWEYDTSCCLAALSRHQPRNHFKNTATIVS